MVHANLLTVNQSISALRIRAVEMNSTLLSLQLAFDNFTAACSADVGCEREIPMIPFLYGLDAVSNL